MSSLTMADRHVLEQFLDMSGGYVLNFSDTTFSQAVFEAVGTDIHDAKYTTEGTSKAKKLRSFWKQETDYNVGMLILALINYDAACSHNPTPQRSALAEKSRVIASRLIAGGGPSLGPLKEHARKLDAQHLAEQIRRMEAAVESDPSLAIGTAKELFETCCKTILAERGQPVTGSPDISTLSKATFKALKLVPETIPDASRGADIIKRLLSNLATVGMGIAELRNLYGTGHGKHGSSAGLSPRHAKLAVGAAATLTVFLFETHKETKA